MRTEIKRRSVSNCVSHWATQTDTPFCRSRVSPSADQSSANMIKLSKLNLKLALKGFCATREDIEDQARTIYHSGLTLPLKIALLAGRQMTIEDD